MSVNKIFLVGLNHLSAPLACREGAAVPPTALLEVSTSLRSSAMASEIVVLSTCSRVEVIGVSEEPSAAQDRVHDWFLRQAGPGVEKSLYTLSGREVLHHVFKVASGLDSWIIGESEILGQVKRAYHAALEGGFTKRTLNRLFQSAIGAGKDVRAATGIHNGIKSIGGAAALVAKRIFGDELGGGITVFGAGEVAEAVVRHLAAKSFSQIVVANRTLENGESLAGKLGGRAVSFQEGLLQLAKMDVAVFSTSSPHPLLDTNMLTSLLKNRMKSLFLIDLGMPRNIHPNCSKMERVYLYNLDDLKEIVRESMESKSAIKAQADSLAIQAAEECCLQLEKARGEFQLAI